MQWIARKMYPSSGFFLSRSMMRTKIANDCMFGWTMMLLTVHSVSLIVCPLFLFVHSEFCIEKSKLLSGVYECSCCPLLNFIISLVWIIFGHTHTHTATTFIHSSTTFILRHLLHSNLQIPNHQYYQIVGSCIIDDDRFFGRRIQRIRSTDGEFLMVLLLLLVVVLPDSTAVEEEARIISSLHSSSSSVTSSILVHIYN